MNGPFRLLSAFLPLNLKIIRKANFCKLYALLRRYVREIAYEIELTRDSFSQKVSKHNALNFTVAFIDS